MRQVILRKNSFFFISFLNPVVGIPPLTNPKENRKRKDLLMWLRISAISSLLFSYIEIEGMEENENRCFDLMLAIVLWKHVYSLALMKIRWCCCANCYLNMLIYC